MLPNFLLLDFVRSVLSLNPSPTIAEGATDAGITMNFVKTSIFQQEFTQGGVKETETSARSKDELLVEERLSKLPEFSRDPQFRSLAEQLRDGTSPEAPKESPSVEETQNPFAPAAVTEEEFEFYEVLNRREKSRLALRQKEDEEMREEFSKAKEIATRRRSSKRAIEDVDTAYTEVTEQLPLPPIKNQPSLFQATKSERFSNSSSKASMESRQPLANVMIKKRKNEAFEQSTVPLDPSSGETISNKILPDEEEKSSVEKKSRDSLLDLLGGYCDSEEE
ncbi:hypothetical protein IE077_002271 [Cardiosporidium cionae]|uniref:FAM192A/Fyv6 N-terminal domain-containing protein n=1 Tax=Cardiosporidium cionae TaxID=476202 RepID=A0ABQ7JB79_9APIC|nr:hypothetical protein IE077_002271 [Cardiosporidium cionae]|eukprot:KAF8821244.1 hypothetical protein IE077_002271 [Cardiosporidium cionae]